LEVSAVKRIHVGMSSADVEKHMGGAAETLTASDGHVVARYYFHEAHRNSEASPVGRDRIPASVLFRTLTVLYGRDGKVERKVHDESVNAIRRDEMEWVEIGPKLDTESLRIRKGVDRSSDLIARLGEPISRTLEPSGHPVLIWLYYRERSNRLGKPVVRSLRVLLEKDEVVADYVLVDSAPAFGLFR
jgi:hypothetical protein